MEPRFKNVRIFSFGYNSDWGERKGSIITIHDFIFNPNPEISLAAIVYEDGQVVTLNPFTQ